jgi:hypothetical protein
MPDPAERLAAAADKLEAKLNEAAWCTCDHPSGVHNRYGCLHGQTWKTAATCRCRQYQPNLGSGEVHTPWPIGQQIGRPLVAWLRWEIPSARSSGDGYDTPALALADAILGRADG